VTEVYSREGKRTKKILYKKKIPLIKRGISNQNKSTENQSIEKTHRQYTIFIF